jgi:hypothetical protein
MDVEKVKDKCAPNYDDRKKKQGKPRFPKKNSQVTQLSAQDVSPSPLHPTLLIEREN